MHARASEHRDVICGKMAVPVHESGVWPAVDPERRRPAERPDLRLQRPAVRGRRPARRLRRGLPGRMRAAHRREKAERPVLAADGEPVDVDGLRSAAAVAKPELAQVDVQARLRPRHKRRMPAFVPDMVPRVLKIVRPEVERLHEHREVRPERHPVAYRIRERHPAHVALVAIVLRTHVVDVLFRHCRLVQPHVAARIPVDVVLERPASEPRHPLERTLQPHRQPKARQDGELAAWLALVDHGHDAVAVNGPPGHMLERRGLRRRHLHLAPDPDAVLAALHLDWPCVVAQLRKAQVRERTPEPTVVVVRHRPPARQPRAVHDAITVAHDDLSVHGQPRNRPRAPGELDLRRPAAHDDRLGRLRDFGPGSRIRPRRRGHLSPERQLVVRYLEALVRPYGRLLQAERHAVEAFRPWRRTKPLRLRQHKAPAFVRRDMRNIQQSPGDLPAALRKRPASLEAVCRREIELVPQLRLAFRRILRRDDEAPLDVRHLHVLRRRTAVGADHAVDTEVAVVRHLVVVAAIRMERVSASVVADAVGPDEHGLVDPVPYAAAGQRVVPVEDLPVLLEVPYRVAHRVRVFAHEVALAVLRAALQLVERQVAVAVDREVLVVVAVDVETRVVDAAHRSAHDLEVVARPRLVAERPHDYARMVCERLDHAHAALGMALRPARRIRKRPVAVEHPVRLDVRLALHVDSVAVAKAVEVRVVWIVACAHHVEVAPLHQLHVAPHLVPRNRPPVDARHVVPVHAPELDRTPVHENRAGLRKLDLAEADLRRAHVAALPCDERV